MPTICECQQLFRAIASFFHRADAKEAIVDPLLATFYNKWLVSWL